MLWPLLFTILVSPLTSVAAFHKVLNSWWCSTLHCSLLLRLGDLHRFHPIRSHVSLLLLQTQWPCLKPWKIQYSGHIWARWISHQHSKYGHCRDLCDIVWSCYAFQCHTWLLTLISMSPSSAKYHISTSLRHLKHALNDYTAKYIGQTLVSSRLDYVNGILYGICKRLTAPSLKTEIVSRTFRVTAPTVWNSIPCDVHILSLLSRFVLTLTHFMCVLMLCWIVFWKRWTSQRFMWNQSRRLHLSITGLITTAFLTLVIAHFQYTFPEIGGFLTAVDIRRINPVFGRAHKSGLTTTVPTASDLNEKVDKKLCTAAVLNITHCLLSLLFPVRESDSFCRSVRKKCHSFVMLLVWTNLHMKKVLL